MISGRHMAIILGILIFVVLNSGCIFIGGFADVFSIGDDFNNINKLNKTENGTYSVAGVSFIAPDGWYVETDDFNGDAMIMGGSSNGINFLNFYPIFQIEIINNSEISNSNETYYETPYNEIENDQFSNGGTVIPGELVLGNSSNYTSISTNSLSEQEIIDLIRNGTNSVGTKISNDTIVIDGKTAYRDVYVVNNLWLPVINQRMEQIVFVKNEKAYLIIFEVPNWDYSKEKQNFDTIINSFKVQ